jgi:type IV pilus assembly protein PilF
MKLENIKLILFIVLLLSTLISACTNTPWHKKQAEIFLNKGIAFLEVKQTNNALKELLEAEKYSPNDHKIHYFLGMAYDDKGLEEKAIEEFQKAISLKDDYSEAHNYLGVIYLRKSQWDQAINEFNKALANPVYDTPAVALYSEGWAYYKKKEYQTALSKNIEALRAEPRNILRPLIEKNIGLIYLDQLNVIEAIQHFKISVELDQSLYDTYYLLGECYLKIKDKANAKKAFQAVIKLSPQSSFGQQAKTYLQSLK